MPKTKTPQEEGKKKALKLKNPNTRGKNFAGQSNGQFEQDVKRRGGQYVGAGEPPRMLR